MKQSLRYATVVFVFFASGVLAQPTTNRSLSDEVAIFSAAWTAVKARVPAPVRLSPPTEQTGPTVIPIHSKMAPASFMALLQAVKLDSASVENTPKTCQRVLVAGVAQDRNCRFKDIASIASLATVREAGDTVVVAIRWFANPKDLVKPTYDTGNLHASMVRGKSGNWEAVRIIAPWASRGGPPPR